MGTFLCWANTARSVLDNGEHKRHAQGSGIKESRGSVLTKTDMRSYDIDAQSSATALMAVVSFWMMSRVGSKCNPSNTAKPVDQITHSLHEWMRS